LRARLWRRSRQGQGSGESLVQGHQVPGVREMPGSVCVYIAAGDVFTHGWDLARATGQPSDLDSELAALLLARIEPLLPDSMRGPGGAGAVRPGRRGRRLGAGR
jgi:hypothetical protein